MMKLLSCLHFCDNLNKNLNRNFHNMHIHDYVQYYLFYLMMLESQQILRIFPNEIFNSFCFSFSGCFMWKIDENESTKEFIICAGKLNLTCFSISVFPFNSLYFAMNLIAHSNFQEPMWLR